MAVATEELAEFLQQFDHFATCTEEIFDLDDQLVRALKLLDHPEAISVKKVAEMRRILLEQAKHRQQHRETLERLRVVFARLQDTPDYLPRTRFQPPHEEEAKAMVGCLATAVGFALVAGVMLGMWLTG